jgi:CRISPR-associated protein Csd1
MILQALNEYYERKFAHQDDTAGASVSIAPRGFENKEIPFVLVLDKSGALVQIEDTRNGEGKKKQARSFLLPQSAKKSVNVAANLLWGNAEYVLGIPDPKKLENNRRKGTETRYRGRLAEMHHAFIDLIRARLVSVLNDAGMTAVLAYLDEIDLERLVKEPTWPEIEGKNPNLTFRLAGDGSDMPVCARPAVVAELRKADAVQDSDESEPGLCLVTGQFDKIERLHPALKGVWGAQTSGANIVSFNLGAFNSYGKDQGANAPIGERAAFTYTTALNHLLRKGSPQRLQIGDASTVFWAAEKSGFENEFAALFSGGGKDDPDRGVQAVCSLLEATKTGVYLPDDKDTRFCVLGLAPNAARIAVRFWQIGPVKEFALHIAQHFRDIEIERPAYESEYLPLWRLLNSTALQGKSGNVPPDLAGDTVRAILTGLPYPAMLLQAAIRRCRAEQAITYPRAAVIKASLNRLFRPQKAKELAVSLDKSNTDPGYRLGRLFAALERIQSAAQPGINATIRDRYYGAASSSPASVFPVLLRLKNHHLAKLDSPGLVTWYEKLLGEIIDGLGNFPSQLNLREQGLFAIGYYHQQQDFFAGKSKAGAPPEPTDTQGES